eukprot:1137976-Pelagomonas_calceolata.AAC.1
MCEQECVMAAAIAADSARHMVLVPGVLRRRYFLICAGVWIVVAEAGTSDGSKFTREMLIGSYEFGVRTGRNMKAAAASAFGMAEHPKKRLSGQCSGSAGIVSCGKVGRPFFLELPGPIFGGQYGSGLAGPAKKESYFFASAPVFLHSLASKERLQLRCQASRSRCHGFMQASKLGSIKCLVGELKSAGSYPSTSLYLMTSTSHSQNSQQPVFVSAYHTSEDDVQGHPVIPISVSQAADFLSCRQEKKKTCGNNEIFPYIKQGKGGQIGLKLSYK